MTLVFLSMRMDMRQPRASGSVNAEWVFDPNGAIDLPVIEVFCIQNGCTEARCCGEDCSVPVMDFVTLPYGDRLADQFFINRNAGTIDQAIEPNEGVSNRKRTVRTARHFDEELLQDLRRETKIRVCDHEARTLIFPRRGKARHGCIDQNISVEKAVNVHRCGADPTPVVPCLPRFDQSVPKAVGGWRRTPRPAPFRDHALPPEEKNSKQAHAQGPIESCGATGCLSRAARDAQCLRPAAVANPQRRSASPV